ncbi:MAG: MaoC/PaaZ C-terminal domain-containing protein [Myxococcota bacterium]
MPARISFADIEVGAQIPERKLNILRVQLLRFCGACCDFTATHWNERIAKAVGLPDVIAHGTFTIAQAVRVVSDWLGDPGAVIEYEAKFTRPVVVPDDDRGATLLVSGIVEEKLPNKRILLRMTAIAQGETVMSGARVVAQLA